MLKRIAIFFGFTLLAISSAYAGKEDWVGKFTVNDGSGTSKIVTHSPTGLTCFGFIIGETLHFGKGASINGVVIKEEVYLCRDSDVATFTAEVAKLGKIIDKTITLGPTYSN